MAHVLLPCDLPTWVDVQRHLAQLKTVKDSTQMVQVMAKVYEICCISLDPDDSQPAKEHDGFGHLKRFIEEVLDSDERSKFLQKTLPDIVTHALCLRMVKPPDGFLYSLKKEDEAFELERCFVASLLANAFLNTFPKRNSKTHPTLQDFSFTEFFTHLEKRSHQKKLKLFLRYFDTLEAKPKGFIKFSRKALTGPSLPGWLCSNRPLVPLIVRYEGNVHDAEPQLLRACLCTSLIGGDVLRAATSQEANLFFSFPELLVCLSFVESLGDNEALVAEGIAAIGSGRRSSRQSGWSSKESQLCLLDTTELSGDPDHQFGDSVLLRELNKALAAFTHDTPNLPTSDLMPKHRRQTPVGESSSSEAASSDPLFQCLCKKESSQASRKSSKESKTRRASAKDSHEGRPAVSDSPYFPPIVRSQSEDVPGDPQRQRNNVDSKVMSMPKISAQCLPKPAAPLLKRSSSSRSSSKMSLRTASQSSVELPPIHPVPEEEYYTADEDSGEGSECHSKSSHKRPSVPRKDKRTSIAMSDLLKEELELDYARKHNSSKYINRESSSEISRDNSRTDSVGFVLGGESEEEFERFVNQHERLDDFRKRIRKRNRRRLSKRSSRSSYSGSSSDMEDISEDPELNPMQTHVIRPASSEPSILTAVQQGTEISPPFRLTGEAALLCLGGRKLMVTSSHGQRKAYSYDGVNPNLPVPFRAGFRKRRLDPGQSQSLDREDEFLWSASMIERSSSADDVSTHSRTRDSVDVASPVIETEERSRLWRRWPVAAEPRGSNGEDAQLKAVEWWLAASLADLPFLILYASQEPALNELNNVYSQVLSRHWTVGDLSCEVLRFCRNKTRHRTCPRLFGQLLGTEVMAKSSLNYNLSQQSLD